jgi:hypothetical protein
MQTQHAKREMHPLHSGQNAARAFSGMIIDSVLISPTQMGRETKTNGLLATFVSIKPIFTKNSHFLKNK